MRFALLSRLLLGSCLLVLPTCEALAVQTLSITSSTDTAAVAWPNGAIEQQISFPAAEGLTLPGTLTLPTADPKHASRPPLAVLKQGSGVQDRDGTAGPNKIQQQLAWGLAARGIATLRYDRRAKIARESFSVHPDLDHEVVLDAIAALSWAASVLQTDSHRIFFIGHSLGAQLGPDIVAARLRQAPGSVAGLVLLAGIARPIDQVMREQVADLGIAQGGTPAQIATIQAKYDAIWAQVRDPEVNDGTPAGLKGGVTIGYLRDWLRWNPAAQLKTLTIPCFVARGTKDLNTTQQDFSLLKAAATSPGSEAMEFPGLSHAFIPVAGQPNGHEAIAGRNDQPPASGCVGKMVDQRIAITKVALELHQPHALSQTKVV